MIDNIDDLGKLVGARQKELADFLDLNKSTFGMVIRGDRRLASGAWPQLLNLFECFQKPASSTDAGALYKSHEAESVVAELQHLLTAKEFRLDGMAREMAEKEILYNACIDGLDRLSRVVLKPDNATQRKRQERLINIWRHRLEETLQSCNLQARHRLKLKMAACMAEIEMIRSILEEQA